MKFSLITVTMGDRPGDLARLGASLDAQSYRDFEWIVVSHREHPEFGGGLSRARNFGISQATGSVLAFPDDDAWYGKDVLRDAASILEYPNVDGVSFRVVDEGGRCSAGGWMSGGRKAVTKSSIWHTAVSCSFFVKRFAMGDVRFDERLGVGSGTRFGSGEETDFLLSLLERGARMEYDGTKCVYHPAVSGSVGIAKGWKYGNGCGMTLRRHGYSVMRLLWAVSVQSARAVQSLALLNPRKAIFHSAMAAGRLAGYMLPPADRTAPAPATATC